MIKRKIKMEKRKNFIMQKLYKILLELRNKKTSTFALWQTVSLEKAHINSYVQTLHLDRVSYKNIEALDLLCLTEKFATLVVREGCLRLEYVGIVRVHTQAREKLDFSFLSSAVSC